MLICGGNDRLHGSITDRDTAVKCIAEGRDPYEVKAGDIAQGTLVCVDADADADADADEMLHQMEEHQIKRLPVIENHRLVRIISESDLARTLDEHRLAEFRRRSTPRPDRPTPAVIPGGTRPVCGAGN